MSDQATSLFEQEHMRRVMDSRTTLHKNDQEPTAVLPVPLSEAPCEEALPIVGACLSPLLAVALPCHSVNSLSETAGRLPAVNQTLLTDLNP
jgi:hypothetical protein